MIVPCLTLPVLSPTVRADMGTVAAAAAAAAAAAGWMHILISLFIACFFSSTARYITLAIWLTVLLPPKPVLWNAFCR
jgi:hypothetical protein